MSEKKKKTGPKPNKETVENVEVVASQSSEKGSALKTSHNVETEEAKKLMSTNLLAFQKYIMLRKFSTLTHEQAINFVKRRFKL